MITLTPLIYGLIGLWITTIISNRREQTPLLFGIVSILIWPFILIHWIISVWILWKQKK